MNWKQAFTLGLLAPGVWEGERVPVAYSYNGVVLPGLPEAPVGYEFATILCLDTSSIGGTAVYYLNFSKEKPTTASVLPPRVEYFFSSAFDTWQEQGEKNDSTGLTTFVDWVWTNTDILNTDGSVALAASEPIPVYE